MKRLFKSFHLKPLTSDEAPIYLLGLPSPVGMHFLESSCSLNPFRQLQVLEWLPEFSVQSWSQPPFSTEQLVAV